MQIKLFKRVLFKTIQKKCYFCAKLLTQKFFSMLIMLIKLRSPVTSELMSHYFQSILYVQSTLVIAVTQCPY